MDAEDNIFLRIVRGEVPAEVIFDAPNYMCFKDVQPQAPWHYLMIPKEPIAQFGLAHKTQWPLLAGTLENGVKVLQECAPSPHGRLVINNGVGALQTVFQLHAHLLSGRDFTHSRAEVFAEEVLDCQDFICRRVASSLCKIHVWVELKRTAENLNQAMHQLVEGVFTSTRHLELSHYRLVMEVRPDLREKPIGVHVMMGPELGWPPC